MSFADKLIAPAMAGKGPMPLPSIYRAVAAQARMKHHPLTPAWKATVRNTLQRHCPYSPKHIQHGPWFVPTTSGVWCYASPGREARVFTQPTGREARVIARRKS